MEDSEKKVSRVRSRFEKREKPDPSPISKMAFRWLGGSFLLGLTILGHAILSTRPGRKPDSWQRVWHLEKWRYDQDGFEVSGVRLESKPESGGPPRVSLRMANRTSERVHASVFFSFHDHMNELIATSNFWIESATIGIEPGAEKKLMAPLFIPRSAVDQISHFDVRVSRAKIYRLDKPKKKPAEGAGAI